MKNFFLEHKLALGKFIDEAPDSPTYTRKLCVRFLLC